MAHSHTRRGSTHVPHLSAVLSQTPARSLVQKPCWYLTSSRGIRRDQHPTGVGRGPLLLVAEYSGHATNCTGSKLVFWAHGMERVAKSRDFIWTKQGPRG